MVEITLSKTKIFENHEELLKRGGGGSFYFSTDL